MDKKNWVILFEELRKRLIIITVTIFIFAIASFTFSEQIRQILLWPGQAAYAGLEANGLDLQLIFLTPSEALMANLRLAFITSAIVTLPFILYQVLAVIMAVAGRTKRSAVSLTLFMYVLFALGLSFAYFVVFPFALNFFVGFSGPDLVPQFSIARYISFSASFLIYFGLVFQLPVIFWFLGSAGLVGTAFLRRNRKFALLVVVVFAAIFTPPDPFSQVLMIIPLMLLYEMGIFMVHLSWRKKKRSEITDTHTG